MLRRRRPWRRRRLERATNRAQQALQYAHQLYEQGDYRQPTLWFHRFPI